MCVKNGRFYKANHYCMWKDLLTHKTLPCEMIMCGTAKTILSGSRKENRPNRVHEWNLMITLLMLTASLKAWNSWAIVVYSNIVGCFSNWQFDLGSKCANQSWQYNFDHDSNWNSTSSPTSQLVPSLRISMILPT